MFMTLRVLEGNAAGKEVKVRSSSFFIGRGDDCQMRPTSLSVSRHHCLLLVNDGRASICDLGSRNGTLLNGMPVVGKHQLKSGDKVTVGPLKLEVQLAEILDEQPQMKEPENARVQETIEMEMPEMDSAEENTEDEDLSLAP